MPSTSANDFSTDYWSASLIESLQNRYREVWDSGERPTVEQFLALMSGVFPTNVIRALIEIEVQRRAAVGEPTDIQEYRGRFGDLIDPLHKEIPLFRPQLADDLVESGKPNGSDTRPMVQEVMLSNSSPAGQDKTPIDPKWVQVSHSPTNREPDRVAQAERYVIRSFYNRGGLGEIYWARDRELNRHVALKKVRSDKTGPMQEVALKREATITGQLSHPGVPPIYSLGRNHEGRSFYTMRFVEGETLSKVIGQFHKQFGDQTRPWDRLEFRKLLGNVISVAETIAYAHDQGVIHRDLKPSNIKIGRFSETIVLDWGLAKRIVCDLRIDQPHVTAETCRDGLEDTIEGDSPAESRFSDLHDEILETLRNTDETRWATLQGELRGTIYYMSPEQARGLPDQVDDRSDIFALGAILYKALTNQSPYLGEDFLNILKAAKVCQFPAPRSIKPSIPPALEAICLKAMEKERDDRYQSAKAFAEDLERWLADEPVQIHRDPFPVRLGRWGRRHRPLVTGMAVAAVALIAFGLVGAVGTARYIEDIQFEKSNALGAEQRALDNLRIARNAGQRALNNLKIARDAEQRALKNLEIARDANREARTIVETDLANVPRSDAVRRKVADIVVQLDRDLMDRYPDSPALKRELIRDLREQANAHRLTGLNDQAQAIYDEAIRNLSKMIDSPQGIALDRIYLAMVLNDAGANELATLEFEAAETFFDRADEVLQPLVVPDGPADVRKNAELILATSEALKALVFHRYGRHREAAELCRSAIDSLESVATGPRSADSLRFLFVKILNNTSRAFRKIGRHNDAKEVARKALDLTEEILATEPDNLTALHSQTVSRIRFVQAQFGDGISDHSRPELINMLSESDHAVEAIDRLVVQNPDWIPIRSTNALAHQVRGQIRLSLGEFEGAVADAGIGLSQATNQLRLNSDDSEAILKCAELIFIQAIARRLQGRSGEASDLREIARELAIQAKSAQLQMRLMVDEVMSFWERSFEQSSDLAERQPSN